MIDIDKIRGDFPILDQQIYGKPLIYLDSGATAQKPQCVIDKVDYLHREMNANIHRGVHYLSQSMTQLYEEARETVRAFIGAEHREEIIFTSGATASVNMVAYSWCDAFLTSGDNIIVSEMEHHSNIVPWQLAAQRKGAEIRVLPFDDDGRLMVELLDELADERTKVIAVTQASNTLGTRPDIEFVVSRARNIGAISVIDGCQGVVHGGVDVAALGCDFYLFSGHKLYAPTGIGVLYGRREVLDLMPPFMSGGDMVDRVSFEQTTFAPLPLRFEAGTANYIGAVGLSEAIRYIEQFDIRTSGTAIILSRRMKISPKGETHKRMKCSPPKVTARKPERSPSNILKRIFRIEQLYAKIAPQGYLRSSACNDFSRPPRHLSTKA